MCMPMCKCAPSSSSSDCTQHCLLLSLSSPFHGPRAPDAHRIRCTARAGRDRAEIGRSAAGSRREVTGRSMCSRKQKIEFLCLRLLPWLYNIGWCFCSILFIVCHTFTQLYVRTDASKADKLSTAWVKLHTRAVCEEYSAQCATYYTISISVPHTSEVSHLLTLCP